MDSVETEGDTIDAAIESALRIARRPDATRSRSISSPKDAREY